MIVDKGADRTVRFVLHLLLVKSVQMNKATF